ncbi:MAG: O-antigen ligase family protein [Thermoleophilaceae bacterium]
MPGRVPPSLSMEAGVAPRRRSSPLARVASSARALRLPSAGPGPIARALLVALPAVLLVYLSFSSGGFYPLTIAMVGILLGLALVVRATVAPRPLEGFGLAVTVALGAFGLLGAWMLASTLWGAASFRAILEFDRLLLYLLGAALTGSIAWRVVERRCMVWLTVAGSLGVCLLGLASRLVSNVWTVEDGDFATGPLAYPLGYTNALGIFAGLGLVLAFYLTTDERGPRVVRVLGAAAMPALAATLLLTFSRGGILFTGFALVIYVVLGRPRGLIGGLLGALVPTLYALSATYGADLISPGLPATPAAVAQAHDLVVALVLATLAGAVLRAASLLVDAPLARVRVGRRTRMAVFGAAGALAVTGVLAVFLSFDVLGVAAQQYDRLVNGIEPATVTPQERLTAPGASGRFEEWGVAWREFRARPGLGSGAGTYQAVWAQERPVPRELRDAHSLYFEVASELGAVGLVLTLLAIGSIAVGLAARCRGPERALYGALLAAWLGWAGHAGIDWDWEVPAITMPVLLLATAGLAARPERGLARGHRSGSPVRLTRVLVGVGVLTLLVTPALVAVSQVRLESSLRAWKQGDCPRTIDDALGSLDAMPVRTEPFELIAYCDSRFALNDLAEGAMQSALARDRRSWDLWYGLALVHGAGRRDPRPAMAEAVRLNPLEPMTIEGSRMFRTDDPGEWQRRALSAPLPIP